MSDEQFLTSPFLPRFHLFSHKLKLKSVKKLHLEIGGGLQNPQDPPSYGPGLHSAEMISCNEFTVHLVLCLNDVIISRTRLIMLTGLPLVRFSFKFVCLPRVID